MAKGPVLNAYNHDTIDCMECINFDGYKNEQGYGIKRYQGNLWKAHRLAWTLKHGPIPAGLIVCHSCDNPSCINVEHLWLGTKAHNNADKGFKGRSYNGRAERTACGKGHSYADGRYSITPEGHRRCLECKRIARQVKS